MIEGRQDAPASSSWHPEGPDRTDKEEWRAGRAVGDICSEQHTGASAHLPTTLEPRPRPNALIIASKQAREIVPESVSLIKFGPFSALVSLTACHASISRDRYRVKYIRVNDAAAVRIHQLRRAASVKIKLPFKGVGKRRAFSCFLSFPSFFGGIFRCSQTTIRPGQHSIDVLYSRFFQRKSTRSIVDVVFTGIRTVQTRVCVRALGKTEKLAFFGPGAQAGATGSQTGSLVRVQLFCQ